MADNQEDCVTTNEIIDEPSASTTSTTTTTTTHKSDPSLLEAYRYINGIPGKNVRGRLVDCFQLWFRVVDDDDSNNILSAIKEIIGDLHNASLLVDDIEDNSKLRRGVPVAHSIFGIPNVINTANYVYFLALEKCQNLHNPQAMQVFVGELLNLHRGQGHDIAWRDSGTCPTEEQYCDMVKDKTGGLFRLAVGLMRAFATTNQEMDVTLLVDNLGLYFQIRDDFINLVDEEYMKSKSFCEDLTEGKFSFPIIHCVQSQLQTQTHAGQNFADTRLLSILKQRTGDVDVKRYAQGLMREAGSFVYTHEKCNQLKHDIQTQIEGFGGNQPLWELIEYLHVQLDGLSGGSSGGTGTVELPPQQSQSQQLPPDIGSTHAHVDASASSAMQFDSA